MNDNKDEPNVMYPTMNLRWQEWKSETGSGTELQQKFIGRFPKWDVDKGYGYDELRIEWRKVPTV